MRIKNINELLEFNPSKVYMGRWNSISNDYQTLYAVNIFLDKEKNKYKNTQPIPCIIQYGGRYIDDEGHYCLITLSQDLWTEHFRYNYIDRIDEVLLHGEVNARGSLTYMHKFPYFVLFTTKTEAYEYIDEYKRNHDLIKHKEKLTRINKDIEILLNEKERLESLIANYENNN